LKTVFNYTPAQILNHSFLISIVDFLGIILITYLSAKIYPLRILKVKIVIFSTSLIFIPYLLQNVTMPVHLFCIQSFIVLFAVDSSPASAIFYKHFPVFKRFTYAGFMYASSRALIYICSSFGFVYLVERYSHFGILIIMIPITIGFNFAILHFSKLEREAGNYN